MFVHALGASQQLGIGLRTDGDHQRQANRRPQRKTTADPVPERKNRVLVDPEVNRPLRFGGQGSKMLRDGSGITKAASSQLRAVCALSIVS